MGRVPLSGSPIKKRTATTRNQNHDKQARTTAHHEQTQRQPRERGRKPQSTSQLVETQTSRTRADRTEQDRKSDIPNHFANHPTPRSQITPTDLEARVDMQKDGGQDTYTMGERCVTPGLARKQNVTPPEHPTFQQTKSHTMRNRPGVTPSPPRPLLLTSFGSKRRTEIVYRL